MASGGKFLPRSATVAARDRVTWNSICRAAGKVIAKRRFRVFHRGKNPRVTAAPPGNRAFAKLLHYPPKEGNRNLIALVGSSLGCLRGRPMTKAVLALLGVLSSSLPFPAGAARLHCQISALLTCGDDQHCSVPPRPPAEFWVVIDTELPKVDRCTRDNGCETVEGVTVTSSYGGLVFAAPALAWIGSLSKPGDKGNRKYTAVEPLVSGGMVFMKFGECYPSP